MRPLLRSTIAYSAVAAIMGRQVLAAMGTAVAGRLGQIARQNTYTWAIAELEVWSGASR